MEYRNGSYDSTVYLHFFDPKSITDIKELSRRDARALDDIERLQEEIEKIKAYRLELMQRCQYLSENPGKLIIKLNRHKCYYGNVEYYLIRERIFPDGSSRDEYREKYPGKERHQAIKDFKAMCKAFPGAENEMDIQKSKRER